MGRAEWSPLCSGHGGVGVKLQTGAGQELTKGPSRGDRFAGLGLKARAGSGGLKKASGGMKHRA